MNKKNAENFWFTLGWTEQLLADFADVSLTRATLKMGDVVCHDNTIKVVYLVQYGAST